MTEAIRQRLLDEMARLRAEIEREQATSRTETMGQLAGEVHDPDEEASIGARAQVNTALLTHHQNALRAIERALTRLDIGTYGVCTACGETIDERRLEVRPDSERCGPCQEAHEAAAGY